MLLIDECVDLNLNDHAFGNSELADSVLEEDPPRPPPEECGEDRVSVDGEPIGW